MGLHFGSKLRLIELGREEAVAGAPFSVAIEEVVERAVLEECFQTPIDGAVYAELIDRLRAEGAVRPAVVDNSALIHTAWDIGAPLNTVVWYFQLVAAEFRVIDCDSDLDLTPVQRVARMLAKGYLYGSHYLPHDAMATLHSGRPF